MTQVLCPLISDYPEGPARHLDASRQKLTPHCLAAIFDSQLPSPKLSHKMPPKLPLPHNRGHFFLFQNCPRGEGNCAAIERQKIVSRQFLPRGIKMPLRALWVKNCLTPSSADPFYPVLTICGPSGKLMLRLHQFESDGHCVTWGLKRSQWMSARCTRPCRLRLHTRMERERLAATQPKTLSTHTPLIKGVEVHPLN